MRDPEVIFYDNHLLVLNKPAGMLTQPNESSAPSLEAYGKAWLKNRFNKPGNVFCGAVHRIDRPVSGLVLFARTSKALSRLQAAQREGLFQKRYLAIIEGEIEHDEQELEHYLFHDDFHARVVDSQVPGAKRSLLKYRALKKADGYTLLSILLETGRYHQIRAQFSASGYPIVGDRKYGSQASFDTIALHHYQLQAPHPITQAPCQWAADLPDHWASFFAKSSFWGKFRNEGAACLSNLAAQPF